MILTAILSEQLGKSVDGPIRFVASSKNGARLPMGRRAVASLARKPRLSLMGNVDAPLGFLPCYHVHWCGGRGRQHHPRPAPSRAVPIPPLCLALVAEFTAARSGGLLLIVARRPVGTVPAKVPSVRASALTIRAGHFNAPPYGVRSDSQGTDTTAQHTILFRR